MWKRTVWNVHIPLKPGIEITNKQAPEKVALWKFPSENCWQTSFIRSGSRRNKLANSVQTFGARCRLGLFAHSSSVAPDTEEMRTDVSHLQAGRMSPGRVLKWVAAGRVSPPSRWKRVLVPSGLKVFYDVAAVWLTLRKKKLLVALPGLLSVVKSREKKRGEGL